MSAEKLDTEVRQDQIAQAALSLVATHGLKGLSMARVARRVGIVPSAIYRHFRDKDEVLDAAIGYIQKGLLDNVDVVCKETSDSRERLRRLLMLHVKLIRENQGIPRIIFSEDVYNGHPERKTKVYEIIKGYLERVGKIVRQGQQEGRIRSDVEPATVSLMFLGMIQPAAILWHMSDGKSDVTRHTEKAWMIFNECLKGK
ncbi:MAG: TetR/AcrR family transcriptional regulator [Candidatus Brocadia sp.]|nr:TetR/AcrR family transcriptional regulator [Candidatus Brocadia sp.]